MRRTHVTSVILSLILAASMSLFGSSASATSPRSRTLGGREGVPAFGHVFVIIGENTALGQLRARRTPYLVNTLKPNAAWETNYYSFHADGSLANYIGLTSGQYTRCDVNNNLPVKCHQDVNNLFHQLDQAGLTWKLWAESATGPCDFIDSGMAWTGNVYGAHHNPAIYYDDIVGGVYDENKAPKQECIDNVVPMGTTASNDTTAFDAAAASGDVADVNFIVPNDCENGHDPCFGSGNRFGQYDAFLQREIPKIEASPAFGTDGVIFTTYDEGADPPYQNRHNILLAASGPLVRPGTYGGGRHFTHYSLLRTIEDGLGLAYLAGANTARPLTDFWA
ncbi:MAG: alkaline phosphatase family protein [Actinomycetota bacterium]